MFLETKDRRQNAQARLIILPKVVGWHCHKDSSDTWKFGDDALDPSDHFFSVGCLDLNGSDGFAVFEYCRELAHLKSFPEISASSPLVVLNAGTILHFSLTGCKG